MSLPLPPVSFPNKRTNDQTRKSAGPQRGKKDGAATAADRSDLPARRLRATTTTTTDRAVATATTTTTGTMEAAAAAAGGGATTSKLAFFPPLMLSWTLSYCLPTNVDCGALWLGFSV